MGAFACSRAATAAGRWCFLGGGGHDSHVTLRWRHCFAAPRPVGAVLVAALVAVHTSLANSKV